jgi:hypothetical protein
LIKAIIRNFIWFIERNLTMTNAEHIRNMADEELAKIPDMTIEEIYQALIELDK